MKLSALFVCLVVCLATLTAPIAAGETDATIYVGHGIPGGDLGLDDALPVDVLVVGVGCVLENFQFGEFAGPLALPAGTYDIEVRLADLTTPCAGGIAISASVPLNMMENTTILAHLDGNGNATASKFGNNIGATALGIGRVSAHHAAAAPAVDVYAKQNGSSDAPIKVFANVVNGQQGVAEVPVGKWSAALRPADAEPIVLGPARVRVQDRSLVNVYAVGSLSTGSLTFLVQRIRTDAP